MLNRAHDIMIGMLVLIAITMAITTNYWLPYISHMSYLFNDNITLGLIAIVIVLLTLYDCKLGLAFAFIVAVIGVNMQNEGFEAFESIKKQTNTNKAPKKNTETIEQFQNMAPVTSMNNITGNNIIADKIEKQMKMPTTCPIVTSKKDFNTYSAGKDYHGYDVAGCRYDLENRTQNSTVHGPPLSWCATYDNSNKLPVPFYPLNG